MARPLDPFTAASRQAARALRRMPPELRRTSARHVRDEVVEPLARKVATGWRGPKAGPLAAGTKARIAGDPTLAVGGRRPAYSGGASVNHVVYGTEFGSAGRRKARVDPVNARAHDRHVTRQFSRAGQDNIYGTVRADAARILEAWVSVMDEYLDEWERGK